MTAPGRQAANGDELIAALADATRRSRRPAGRRRRGTPCMGRRGRSDATTRPDSVAVVDLGGGSCRARRRAHRTSGPSWVRSIDAGSLRVTRAAPGRHDAGRGAGCSTAGDAIRRLVAPTRPATARQRRSSSEARRARSAGSSARASASRSSTSSSMRCAASHPRRSLISHGVTPGACRDAPRRDARPRGARVPARRHARGRAGRAARRRGPDSCSVGRAVA